MSTTLCSTTTRYRADLSAHLEREFGRAHRDRYWSIFEALRAELGYADYLGALQRYRLENLDEPQLLLDVLAS